MAIPPSNGKTILITGVNGYIASVLGAHLLEKGYSLRGTSRRAASTEALVKGPYAKYAERVQFYEVPDMTIDGAFDEAVKGVHGIFHTASPIDFSLTTYEQTIIPAIRGSEVLLSSALKAGSQLVSVVITSSVAAVTNPKTEAYTFTEEDWASAALEKAQKDHDDGVLTPPGILYAASKTAADRAVWKFRGEHKPSFSISTINPSIVIGPPVLLPSSFEKLNETLRPVFDIFSGATQTIPPNFGSGAFVDVRDVAFIHTWALEHPSEANGQRYIASGGFGPKQGTADILREAYKGTPIGDKIVVGTPGEGYVGYNKETGHVEFVDFPPEAVKISGKKAEEATGVKYISLSRSLRDTVESFKSLL